MDAEPAGVLRFGVMTFRPDSAKLAVYSVAGVPQLT
jgi:hypothetical protein